MAEGNLLIENYLPVVKLNKGIATKYPVSFEGSGTGFNSVLDTAPVKINSRNYPTQTSGSDIALQTKPNATISGTQSVVGAQFSPRFASGISGASVVGVQSQPLLEGGTTTLTGDFGGFEADLTDSQTGGNTIGGDVYALRGYLNMASQTITGNVLAIKIDDAGGAQQWTAFARLPNDSAMAKLTGTTTTQAGWIKVIIGSTTKYIPLYTTQS